MKKNTYTIPLALVFCLFFLWAISSNLLPTMIRQLMKTCELNTFEASFTETAYWLAYFIFPIPIAMFMKRYSYKAGIIVGGIGRFALFSGCHAESLLGLPLHILYHCYRYVFPGDCRQSVCYRFRCTRNSTATAESGAIFQRTRSLYFCYVSE